MYETTYKQWLTSSRITTKEREFLMHMKNDHERIHQYFEGELSFGTGGIRGVMQVGPKGINPITVQRATQGLMNWLNKQYEKVRLAIAYDSRNNSKEFALVAASVMLANGAEVYCYDSLRPTPMLSYAIRHLECQAGIVLTASHNPPKYNGYKVYGEDGGQITLETANAIKTEMKDINYFGAKIIDDLNLVAAQPGFHYIDASVDAAYYADVLSLSRLETPRTYVAPLKIIYTPLHGAGYLPVKSILEKLGCENISIVSEQATPDGNFPTVKSPNPEDHAAFDLALKKNEAIDADLLLATDPDCDRLGVVVKNATGSLTFLDGNQVGALLISYLAEMTNDIGSQYAVIKTIVTSNLGASIAKAYGITIFETLTGFKFIGEKIKSFEMDKNYTFLFGYEESYGYLAGDFVRDKDAVIAAMLVTEMAGYYKSQGLSLIDVLESLYSRFGYYKEALYALTLEGAEGLTRIEKIMKLAEDYSTWNPLKNELKAIENYNKQERFVIAGDVCEIMTLPKSNVIKLIFNDDSWFAIRPSGTEPKLKIYVSGLGDNATDALIRIQYLKSNVEKILDITL